MGVGKEDSVQAVSLSRRACARKSGVVSITTARPSNWTSSEGRVRLIVRIARSANRAMAGEDGHSGGGPGPQESQSHLLFRACRFCNSTNLMRSS